MVMSKAGAALHVAPALRLYIYMMRRRPDKKQILIGGVEHVPSQCHETMKARYVVTNLFVT